MCTDLDKTQRSIELQNFKYAPAWDEFCHIIYIVSPRAHQILRSHFPVCTDRSFRYSNFIGSPSLVALLRTLTPSHKEAHEPRFPMDICNRTFELAKGHLTALDYHGPVTLACNDTKLFPTLRLYWDKEKGNYFLVGACGGPICVPNVVAAQEVLADPGIKKAPKVIYGLFTSPHGNEYGLSRFTCGA